MPKGDRSRRDWCESVTKAHQQHRDEINEMAALRNSDGFEKTVASGNVPLQAHSAQHEDDHHSNGLQSSLQIRHGGLVTENLKT